MAVDQFALVGIVLGVAILVILFAFSIWFACSGIQKHIKKERRIRDKMMAKYGVEAMGYNFGYQPALGI